VADGAIPSLPRDPVGDADANDCGALKSLALAVALASCAFAACAQTPTLKRELAAVSFLIGDWSGGKGVVADTGGTSTGVSRITVAANGAVLLRQDRTSLFDKAGRPSGGFDQIMMIYPEAGTLRADYSDGTHVIHYTRADIAPGKSISFSSASQPGAPVFRLTYTLTAADTLSVTFGMTAPGAVAFTPIATGVLHKDR
jgi:hypothetical protein